MEELNTLHAVDGTETEPAAGESPEASQETKTPFQNLIAGEYRQDYEKAVGQRIRAAIQNRFKNQPDYKKQLDDVQPILQTLGGRYGLNAEDVQGIAERLARESGDMPARDFLQEHVRGINAQAEEMKKELPGFDLSAEMENPAFVRMTSPGVGMSVKDAYFAVHGQEIQRDSMLYAARQANERIAASVMAGASRPRENGLDPVGAASMGINVQTMDRKTREAFRRRIKNGEKINFMDQV
ncbi:MAG: hypothetical protein IKH57_22665 [Clostridia bacterium]|nr:hypothetical protein [Clostridia bacterium]